MMDFGWELIFQRVSDPAPLWGVVPYADNQQFSDSSSRVPRVHQFWPWLPGDSIRFHKLKAQSHKTTPSPLQMMVTRPGCHLCFWPTSYRSEVPTTPSLGSINLLESLIELRETFYFLDHWFIIKGYNPGTPSWKRCIGWDVREGHGVFMFFLPV